MLPNLGPLEMAGFACGSLPFARHVHELGVSMNRILLASFMFVALAAAALAQTASMTAEQGIAAAAANPDVGIAGTFEFVVQSVGETKASQGTIVYLNSENDYRSPGNISAMIMPSTAKALAAQLGGPVRDRLIGRSVAVTGTAKQTRINLFDEKTGKRTGQYYFQTRISVKGIEQISVR